MTHFPNRLAATVRARPPLRYAISNRLLFSGWNPTDYLAALLRTPAHLVQVREKDLDRATLRSLVRACLPAAKGNGRLLVVNSDVELALEEEADGVHLPGITSVKEAVEARDVAGLDRFLIGKSVHSIEEAVDAAEDGADYLLFGPVFAPTSKESHTSPLGLASLHEAVTRVSVPIFALGGINADNESLVLETGVIGIAGISWVRRYLDTVPPPDSMDELDGRP